MAEPWDLAIRWVQEEHDLYQVQKTPPETDDVRTLNTPEEWGKLIAHYLDHGCELGLADPLGRQAIAKGAAICTAYLESVFRVFGSIPTPGYSTGKNAGTFGPYTR